MTDIGNAYTGNLSSICHLLVIDKVADNWITGHGALRSGRNIDVSIKAFAEGSIYGIAEGRISKLWIVDTKTREVLCNYERDWDITPKGEVRTFMQQLVRALA